jgi:hypothetical protein
MDQPLLVRPAPVPHSPVARPFDAPLGRVSHSAHDEDHDNARLDEAGDGLGERDDDLVERLDAAEEAKDAEGAQHAQHAEPRGRRTVKFVIGPLLDGEDHRWDREDHYLWSGGMGREHRFRARGTMIREVDRRPSAACGAWGRCTACAL